MRTVIQRVLSASVSDAGDAIASIGAGLLLLTGVASGDDADTARRMADKCANLRVFADGEGRFERSLLEVGGEALVVSQFTLLADMRRGRRPSFIGAARPEAAEPVVDAFVDELRALGVRVQCGRFGAHMLVSLQNDGPVTVVLDSGGLDRPRRG